jgi:hypothetical protein
MIKFLLIFIFAFSIEAKADFILSPGVGVTSSYESDATDTSGRRILKMNPGFGFDGSFEIPVFKYFSLTASLNYTSNSGKTQYNFTDPDNTSISASVSDLDTSSFNLSGSIGARLRFINTKKLKIFLGGGFSSGILGLTYNKSEFEDRTGSLVGFEDMESQSLAGSYQEAGGEYILTNKSALRVFARLVQFETNEFKTLGNQKVSADYTQFLVQYMHYVDWTFFWR